MWRQLTRLCDSLLECCSLSEGLLIHCASAEVSSASTPPVHRHRQSSRWSVPEPLRPMKSESFLIRTNRQEAQNMLCDGDSFAVLVDDSDVGDCS